MTAALAHLATLAGVLDHWIDASGYRHASSDGVLREVLTAMGLDCATPAQLLASTARLHERRRLPPPMITAWLGMPTRLGFALPTPAPFRIHYEDGVVVEGQVFDADGARWLPPVLHAGYHVLEIAGLRIRLAVAPLQACSLADLGPSRPRLWGLSLSPRHAIGHADLSVLARHAAGHGADALAVSDLNVADGRWCDPSRIDVSQTFDAAVPASLADGEQAASLRRLYLDALPRDEALLREYLRFARDGGDALQVRAVHAALRGTHGDATRDWPASLAVVAGGSVAGHAGTHAEEVGFQVFVEWLAMRSQRAAQSAARASGMAIGLIADLPWGASPDGSDVWANAPGYLHGLRVADPWHPDGIAATSSDALGFHPLRLADDGFAPWIDLLRAAMSGVGAIRLLRVDRWQRAWLQSAVEEAAGAHVEQPFDDMLRLLVLESVRHRCAVIVDGVEWMPERWQAMLAQAGLLRIDSFLQRDGTHWKAAGDHPACSVVASSGPDTPGLHAWWQATDIQQRLDDGRISNLVAARERRQRDQDRTRLIGALGIERRRRPRDGQEARGDHPARAVPQRAIADPVPSESQWIDATLLALGQTSASLVLVAIDDLLGDIVDGGELDAANGRAVAGRIDSTAARNRIGRLDEARRADSAHSPSGSVAAPD